MQVPTIPTISILRYFTYFSEPLGREAQANLAPFQNLGVELEYMRMLTSEAVDRISNDSIDFIYVDARHDYCGVKEDLELYFPKLRSGGIIAGGRLVP